MTMYGQFADNVFLARPTHGRRGARMPPPGSQANRHFLQHIGQESSQQPFARSKDQYHSRPAGYSRPFSASPAHHYYVAQDNSVDTVHPDQEMDVFTDQGEEVKELLMDDESVEMKPFIPPHDREPAGRPLSSKKFMDHYYNHTGYHPRAESLPVTYEHMSLHPHHFDGPAPAGKASRHIAHMDVPRRKGRHMDQTPHFHKSLSPQLKAVTKHPLMDSSKYSHPHPTLKGLKGKLPKNLLLQMRQGDYSPTLVQMEKVSPESTPCDGRDETDTPYFPTRYFVYPESTLAVERNMQNSMQSKLKTRPHTTRPRSAYQESTTHNSKNANVSQPRSKSASPRGYPMETMVMHVVMDWQFFDTRPADILNRTSGIVDVAVERVLMGNRALVKLVYDPTQTTHETIKHYVIHSKLMSFDPVVLARKQDTVVGDNPTGSPKFEAKRMNNNNSDDQPIVSKGHYDLRKPNPFRDADEPEESDHQREHRRGHHHKAHHHRHIAHKNNNDADNVGITSGRNLVMYEQNSFEGCPGLEAHEFKLSAPALLKQDSLKNDCTSGSMSMGGSNHNTMRHSPPNKHFQHNQTGKSSGLKVYSNSMDDSCPGLGCENTNMSPAANKECEGVKCASIVARNCPQYRRPTSAHDEDDRQIEASGVYNYEAVYNHGFRMKDLLSPKLKAIDRDYGTMDPKVTKIGLNAIMSQDQPQRSRPRKVERSRQVWSDNSETNTSYYPSSAPVSPYRQPAGAPNVDDIPIRSTGVYDMDAALNAVCQGEFIHRDDVKSVMHEMMHGMHQLPNSARF